MLQSSCAPVKGLHLYGGVGTGKIMLMDLFFDQLPCNWRKKRIHFLDFMLNVHIRLQIDKVAFTFKDGAYHSKVSQHGITGTKVDIPTEEHLKIDRNVLISSEQDALLIQHNQVNLARWLKAVPAKSSTGKETVIIVEEGPIESTATQRAENIGNSPKTGHTPHTTTQLHVGRVSSTAGEVHRVEIIKSIVYGGLVESITSFGVVSSAAGGDAATLNILALGLADLIGGLFVMGHDASKFPLQLLSINKYMTPKSIPIRIPVKF